MYTKSEMKNCLQVFCLKGQRADVEAARNFRDFVLDADERFQLVQKMERTQYTGMKEIKKYTGKKDRKKERHIPVRKMERKKKKYSGK